MLQYIQPGAGSGTPADRHLTQRGPGIFEVRVQVTSLDGARGRAQAAGVSAEPEVRIGAARTALLDPAGMFGGRWLLVEQPGDWPRLGL